MVGSAKFEFATSASQTQNHTKLDHDPSEIRKCPNLSFTDTNYSNLFTYTCQIDEIYNNFQKVKFIMIEYSQRQTISFDITNNTTYYIVTYVCDSLNN